MTENANVETENYDALDTERFNAAVAAAKGIVAAGPTPDLYWQLGEKVISASSRSKTPEVLLRRISEHSGLGFDTIRKSRRFRSMYKSAEVRELMNASFKVSWHLIANNLRIPSSKFIRFCKNSGTPKELNDAIMRWREANPTNRGRAVTNQGGDTQDQGFQTRVNEARNELEELRTTLRTKMDVLGIDGENILDTLEAIIDKLD